MLFFGFTGATICVAILDAPRRAARAQQIQTAYLAQQQYAAHLVQQQREYAAYVAQQQAIQAQQEQEAYMARISTLKGLLSLTPTEFEMAVVELFKFWGYSQVEHTGGGGDLAADIVCYDATGQKTVVQCKCKCFSRAILD